MAEPREIDQAGRLSREYFGERIDFFLPGMFTLYGRKGRYPAVSLTGTQCSLNCDHCSTGLLKTMIPAATPEELVNLARDQKQKGRLGLLLSGGCDERGRLPWAAYLDAIKRIIDETGLIITVHSGLIDLKTARGLKRAGVRQALIDVIADDETARRICHYPDGAAGVLSSLRALYEAGLDVAPHIVAGLDYGKIRGERRAVEILEPFRPQRLVTVVLTPKSGTPMAKVAPPAPEEIIDLLVLRAQRIASSSSPPRLRPPRRQISSGIGSPGRQGRRQRPGRARRRGRGRGPPSWFDGCFSRRMLLPGRERFFIGD